MLDTIREMLDAEPFRPFRIIITSGDRYEVQNPHLVAIGRTELLYFFPRSDRWASIRLNQIVSAETVQSAASTAHPQRFMCPRPRTPGTASAPP